MLFLENAASSHHLNPLPSHHPNPSPAIVFNKAVTRSRSWRPVVLQGHFSSGCSWPWWLLHFILAADLHAWAKSLYLLPARRSLLVPWKVATRCQSSQGSKVLKANQEKKKQIEFRSETDLLPADLQYDRSSTRTCPSNSDVFLTPHPTGVYSRQTEGQANIHMPPLGKPYRFCAKQNQGTVQQHQKLVHITAKSWSLRFLTIPLSAWALEFLLYVFSTWLFWDVTEGRQHLFSSSRLQLCWWRSYCPPHTPSSQHTKCLLLTCSSCSTVSQISKILIYWEWGRKEYSPLSS